MIITVNIPLDKLSLEGKKFNWKQFNVKTCLLCKGKLWGHGFIERYIHNYFTQIYLKRYRCSNNFCRKTYTLSPIGYPKHYGIQLKEVFTFLIYRLKNNKWEKNNLISRQRGLHWLRILKNYCIKVFGVNEQSLNLLSMVIKFASNDSNFLAKEIVNSS